jgi:hypothetical protein
MTSSGKYAPALAAYFLEVRFGSLDDATLVYFALPSFVNRRRSPCSDLRKQAGPGADYVTLPDHSRPHLREGELTSLLEGNVGWRFRNFGEDDPC